MYTTLISTNDLAAHLHDPDWVILDCRFDTDDKNWGREDYQHYHIPGAVFADLEKDMCGAITPTSGRHPLPVPDFLVENFRRFGINKNSQVVVYDSATGGMAGRAWFLLKLYGHSSVALLDGGLPIWLAEGRETIDVVKKLPRGNFNGIPDMKKVASLKEVRGLAEDPHGMLIDARSPERFRGEVEPIDAIAGRIPGAVNRFYGNNVDADGLFLPADVLKREFSTLLGKEKPENAVVYCGSGVTACHHLVAMAHAGLSLPKLYAGSWSEWIGDPSNPIAKG